MSGGGSGRESAPVARMLITLKSLLMLVSFRRFFDGRRTYARRFSLRPDCNDARAFLREALRRVKATIQAGGNANAEGIKGGPGAGIGTPSRLRTLSTQASAS